MKINKIIILVVLVFTVIGCVNKNIEYDIQRAKNIIPFDTLELIVFDITLADAMLTGNVLKNIDLGYEEDSLVYESVFGKYFYTKEQINETILYYTQNNLDSLDYLYEKISERISIEEININ